MEPVTAYFSATSETQGGGLKLKFPLLNMTRDNRDWSITLELLINVSFLLTIFDKVA